jgi:8-oxo-dGTP pyrophosphatase MutT (NUDIX family)
MEDDLPSRLSHLLASPQVREPVDRDARPAAVLVPLYQEGGVWHILFTLRTETVDAHPGQVSFPGGAIEPGDDSPLQAALREAEEEVGLAAEDVHVLGTLEAVPTITGFRIEPLVGSIPWPYPLRINTREVVLAFGVPLTWLADPAHLEVRQIDREPGRSIDVHFFTPYSGQVIWGATARITLGLLRLLGLFPE